MIYVARQLGHDARFTLGTYGHVIDELDGQPQLSAEDAIKGRPRGQDKEGVMRTVAALIVGLALGVAGTLGVQAVTDDSGWHDTYRQCIEQTAIPSFHERYSDPEAYYRPGTPGDICQGRTEP